MTVSQHHIPFQFPENVNPSNLQSLYHYYTIHCFIAKKPDKETRKTKNNRAAHCDCGENDTVNVVRRQGTH